MAKLFIHISLSLIILVSSTGIPLFNHYCNTSNIKLTSVTWKVSCGHEQSKTNTCNTQCDHHPLNTNQESLDFNCCVNYAEVVKVDLNIFKSAKVKIIKPVVSILLILPEIFTNTIFGIHIINNTLILPPFLYSKERVVSFCTFLL